MMMMNDTSQLLISLQNFQPVPVPKDQYGNFFDGDAYIVLCVSNPDHLLLTDWIDLGMFVIIKVKCSQVSLIEVGTVLRTINIYTVMCSLLF